MIPSRCSMRSLAVGEGPGLIPRLIATAAGAGVKGIGEAEGKHIRVLAHVVDKAIREYITAREHVLLQVGEPDRSHAELLEGRHLYIFGIAGHLETCINSVRRASRHLEAIRRVGGFLSVDRQTKRVLEWDSRSVREMRDSIEHLDEDIQRRSFDGPLLLSLGEDASTVALGDRTLRLDTLASVLERLHSVTVDLIGQWRATVGPAAPSSQDAMAD